MKKCPFCAERIKDEAKVCPYCRRELPISEAPIIMPSENNQGSSEVIQNRATSTNWLAVASLILGSLFIAESIFLNVIVILLKDMIPSFLNPDFIIPFAGILMFIPTEIIGIIAIVKRNKYTKPNLWMAIVGIVFGLIGELLNLGLYILIIIAVIMSTPQF
jgi:hypothetical protein